jgi:hypothetical protein
METRSPASHTGFDDPQLFGSHSHVAGYDAEDGDQPAGQEVGPRDVSHDEITSDERRDDEPNTQEGRRPAQPGQILLRSEEKYPIQHEDQDAGDDAGLSIASR